MPIKCPDHPSAGEVHDHWPSFGPGAHLVYCKECSRFLGRVWKEGFRDITDNSEMPWGKHRGKRMIDVPVSYLRWCLDSAMGSDAWGRAVEKYLKQKGVE